MGFGSVGAKPIWDPYKDIKPKDFWLGMAYILAGMFWLLAWDVRVFGWGFSDFWLVMPQGIHRKHKVFFSRDVQIVG